MTTAAKKTAAKKTAASTTTKTSDAQDKAPEATTPAADAAAAETPATAEGDGVAADAEPTGPEQTASGFTQNYGPGTSNVTPPAEDSARTPATIVNTAPDAAPLDPPADSGNQTDPKYGHDWSSTDKTYAEAGGRSIAGETHYRLCDRAGNTLDPDELFEDRNPSQTIVYSRVEIIEEFTYPNTITPVHRRVCGAETPIPRFQADRIVAAAKEDAEVAEAIKASASSEQ